MRFSSRRAGPTLSAGIAALAFICSSLIAVAQPVQQPQVPLRTIEEWRQQTNTGTVRIITKGLGCTCTHIASDMARVLNRLGELRVLPVLGRGSMQGLADILYLKGIDISILQSDVLNYVKSNGMHPSIEGRIRYITRLYDSELHLLAGPDFKTVKDLQGQVVSYDVKGRGSFITAQTVFDAAGVDVQPVYLERDVAIQKVQSGEIAAAFVVTGKPATSIRQIKKVGGIHLMPVEFSPALAQVYVPSQLTHEDYPNLIDEGSTVSTIAVGEVLAVFNWSRSHERYRKIERFVDAFFSNFREFLKPIRHQKWKEVNLSAKVPGWIRFAPAEKKLQEILERPRVARVDDKQQQFADFLSRLSGGNVSEAETALLFEQFLRWSKQQRNN